MSKPEEKPERRKTVNPFDRVFRLDAPHIAPNSEEEVEVYRRLWALGMSDPFHVSDVEELLEESPRIARRLIRVTNSMRHGLHRRITTLRHAIVMLGARGIRGFSEPVIRLLEEQSEEDSQSPVQTDVPAPHVDYGVARSDRPHSAITDFNAKDTDRDGVKRQGGLEEA